MAKVIWTEPALDDMRGISDFIAKDSPTYAQRMAAKLVASPRRLEMWPRSGAVVPEFGQDDIRELFCGAYRVIYLIRGDACYVVAVIHGSRDLLRHVDPKDWDEN